MASRTTPVPEWVYKRLAKTGAGARYEASLYGPLNAFLTSYFPPHQTFMVKPQPKIRPHFEADANDPQSRPSLDSYHAAVLPRRFGGWEDPLKSPDFIVVKPTSGPHDDRVLVVVEVKLKHVSEEHAEEQLIDYMGLLLDKYREDTGQAIFDGTLAALLVMGDRLKIFTMPGNGRVEIGTERGFRHAALHAFLAKIAGDNM